MDKTIQIFSVSDPDKKFEEEVPEEYGYYWDIYDWSPDSSKLLLAGMGGKLGKCTYDRIVIYHLTKKSTLDGYAFLLSESGCPTGVWSPDSKKVFVANHARMYILNDKAEILETAPLDYGAKLDILWTEQGLFIDMMDTKGASTFYWSKDGTLENMEVLWKPDIPSGMVSISPDGQYLLTVLRESGFSKKVYLSYTVVDIQSKQVVKELKLDRDSRRYSSDATIIFPNGDYSLNGQLYHFNWEKMEFVNCGEAWEIIHYDSIENGYLVSKVMLNDERRYALLKCEE